TCEYVTIDLWLARTDPAAVRTLNVAESDKYRLPAIWPPPHLIQTTPTRWPLMAAGTCDKSPCGGQSRTIRARVVWVRFRRARPMWWRGVPTGLWVTKTPEACVVTGIALAGATDVKTWVSASPDRAHILRALTPECPQPLGWPSVRPTPRAENRLR